MYSTLCRTDTIINQQFQFNIQPDQSEIYSAWADPSKTLSVVKQHFADMPPAQATDICIKLACWNMEYFWQAKATHFLDSYTEVLSHCHVLAAQEVTNLALAEIAKSVNYQFAISQPNSRGQAVGFVIHPRFHIDKICEYRQLTNVCGVPDLRPALQINLTDRRSSLNLSLITLHLKSMRGEPSFTSYVRKNQLQQLLAVLQENEKSRIIVGDFNCFLDRSEDINCLLQNGYRLANINNHYSTQASEGRLDGLFYNNLPDGMHLAHYKICNFWRNRAIGRSLSDHGLLTWEIVT